MREYRAKYSDKWIYGAYYKFLPYTPSPVIKDETDLPSENEYKHLIITDGFSDWNMPRDLKVYEVEKDTVGQGTGMYDKNNHEIFEGDFIKIPDSWDDYGTAAGMIYEIYYNEGFRLKPKSNPKARGNWLESTKNFEIVGNKIDNPELSY